MIRLGRMFHFVLIALFLFAFQTTALHTKHHFSKGKDHCQVCLASKHLDGGQQHTPSVDLLMDISAVEVSETEEKVLVKVAFDLTQKPGRKSIDLTGFKRFIPQTPPLAYYANAPPYIFS